VKEQPAEPGQRLGKNGSSDLEQLIMRCLAKPPEQRPATAEALEEALVRCGSIGSWSQQQAEQWWRANVVGTEPPPAATMAEKTLVIAPRP
jgi:eukaryotic-like serine/threonine-protein kinase